MRLWRVVVLVNLALAIGVGAGYLRWGREARRLEEELAGARRALAERRAGPEAWTVRGIVRMVLPNVGGVFLTHEAIPGVMPAMTMGFEAETPKLLDGLQPGDRVRFTLRRRGEQLVLVAIEKEARP